MLERDSVVDDVALWILGSQQRSLVELLDFIFSKEVEIIPIFTIQERE